MAATKRLQNKCKKCGYTWYPRGKHISLKCPSCGSSEVGFAGPSIGIVALIVIAILVFGGSKKETPVEAPPAPSVNAEDQTVADHQALRPHLAPEQKDAPIDSGNAPPDAEKVDTRMEATAPSECAAGNEGKPADCSTSDCPSSMSAPQNCQLKRAPQNELY
ncbi:hypothetical protein [Rugamonas aquatica]|uniref:Uncharacterized protein n=1 Tax=Rugamonas aquatica TaxID=2743357 RepID=A0A6A7N631_9BURK|nr:hypothetical protein [Rugamonas aquatica]MQA40358.1 hypothetical protein [Rugamonas aquatica]